MTYDEAITEILKFYPNRLMLTKKDVALITNRSISALDRDIKEGTGIPYKKMRGRILYPTVEVARWMCDTIQTA